MPLSLEEYQAICRANPDAFVEGARAFCKYAASLRLSPDDPDYALATRLPKGWQSIPYDDPRYQQYQRLVQRQRRLSAQDEDDGRSLWERVKPWLLAIGGGALAMHLGSAWGRHAAKEGIPFGPIKGPIMELLAKSLPADTDVYWPGQPGYDAALLWRLQNAEYESRRNPADAKYF